MNYHHHHRTLTIIILMVFTNIHQIPLKLISMLEWSSTEHIYKVTVYILIMLLILRLHMSTHNAENEVSLINYFSV